MYWRKIKLNVILGLVVIAVLCFIILPIVFETTAISGVKNGLKNGGDSEIPPKPVDPVDPVDPNPNPNPNPNPDPNP